jgi:electron transfer flavoprotein beta subunit
MHIIVPLRLVPDTSGEIEIAADGKSIDREWIDIKLNEFDDHALEEAVLLKEATDASLTAVAIAGEGVDRMLQTALARGADKAVKIARDDEAPLSSRAAGPILSDAVRQLGGDLVLTGVQTPEDIHGQLAPFMAAALGWPSVSAVSSARIDGNAIVVQQEFSGGVSALLEVTLPAVIGVQTASYPIRYVSGTKLRQATGEKIAAVEVAFPAGDERAELTGLAAPKASGVATMIEGDAAAIAERIHALLVERALVK